MPDIQIPVEEVVPVAPTPKKSRRPWLWFIPVCIGLILIVFVLYLLLWTKALSGGANSPSLIAQLGSVITQSGTPLQGEETDRVNVLLLGIGGGDHPGGTLTDTIMVASIKPSTHQVALLSLPRDLIVNIDDYGHKINYAYVLGGIELAKKKVTDVTGLPLDYYMVLDFSGFKSVIDDVGGIDVTVPHTFTGYYGANEMSIPCPAQQLQNLLDGAYCAIPFASGEQTMDGEQALIYSRIRKLVPGSDNYAEESGDFARATRQQLVMESFKQKVFSAGTLLRPDRISSMMGDVSTHINTNLELGEMIRVLELVKGVQSADIIRAVVDDSTTKLVKTEIATETGASVVVPVAGDYKYGQIQKLAKGIFNQPETIVSTETTAENTSESTTEATPVTTATVQDTSNTPAKVQVLNGTSHAGLAATFGTQLQHLDITLLKVDNAPLQHQTISKIYDVTAGQRLTDLALLQGMVPGTVATTAELVTLQTADAPFATIDPHADFIIILGDDAATDTVPTE